MAPTSFEPDEDLRASVVALGHMPLAHKRPRDIISVAVSVAAAESKKSPIGVLSNDDGDQMGFVNVEFFDKTRFRIPYSSETTARDLTVEACARAEIRQPELFGIQRVIEKSVDSSDKKKKIGAVWLSEQIPIFKQGVDGDSVLHVMHKYWPLDDSQITDPTSITAIFNELQRKFISGLFTATRDDIVQLAAYHALSFIDRAEDEMSEKQFLATIKMRINELIPPYAIGWSSADEWSRDILIYVQLIYNMSVSDAQAKYIRYAQHAVDHLSTHFFRAAHENTLLGATMSFLIGLSSEGIEIYSQEKDGTLKLQTVIRYVDVSKFKVQFNGNNTMVNTPAMALAAKHLSNTNAAISAQDCYFATSRDPSEIPLWPYRYTLWLKTKNQDCKMLIFELSSIVGEDTTFEVMLTHYIREWNKRIGLEQFSDEAIVTVCTTDKMTKNIVIKSTTSAHDLIEMYSEKVFMKYSSLFHLCIVKFGHVRWLSMNEPIFRQHSNPNGLKLYLRIRYLAHNDPWNIQCPIALRLYSSQVFEMVATSDLQIVQPSSKDGKLTATDENQLAEVCALFAQHDFGDYTPKRLAALPNELPAVIPISKGMGKSFWTKLVGPAWEKLKSKPNHETKGLILKILCAKPIYGPTFFSIISQKSGEHGLLGVSRAGIAMYYGPKRIVIGEYRFDEELVDFTHDGAGNEIWFHVKSASGPETNIIKFISLASIEILDALHVYKVLQKGWTSS